ncbi:hypothetical protein RF11_02464 [Thelohanellus kitauei]|uniref:Uncharacterized protein n=1 Tax=Thelohanellus kitauei TaxID=669202 RepID=A0A0C2MBC0_THEKT|nr:hypothetical protein RF11_02464 [Thelohanellus kitauei]
MGPHRKILISDVTNLVSREDGKFVTFVNYENKKHKFAFLDIWVQGYVSEFNENSVKVHDGTSWLIARGDNQPNFNLGDYVGILGEFDGSCICKIVKLYVMSDGKIYEPLWRAEIRSSLEYMISQNLLS